MGRRKLFVYLLFLSLGVYFLFLDSVISIQLFLLSLYFLYSWMDTRGDRFSTKSYLGLFYILVANGVFSFYENRLFSISLGILSLLLALSAWLSYQQLRIDEREENGE